MTNEEKAREIAEKEVHPIIAERRSLEMAEWKDQQFKEYLEELKSRCEKEYEEAVGNSSLYIEGKTYGRLDSVMEIINELFPESEEPDNSNKDD